MNKDNVILILSLSFTILLITFTIVDLQRAYAIVDPITEIKILTSEGITEHVNNTRAIQEIEHIQNVINNQSQIEKLNSTYSYGNVTLPISLLPANETSQICTPAINSAHNMTMSCINGGNDTQ